MNTTAKKPIEQPSVGEVELIDMERIDIQASPCVRACDHDPTIKEFWNLLVDGVKFPPIDLFWIDDLSAYVVADGRHRYWAHDQNCEKHILARVHKGSSRKALEFALGANSKHGLRLNEADLKCAIKIILKDPEWGNLSNPAIAQMVGCSEITVRRIREKMAPDIPDSCGQDETTLDTVEPGRNETTSAPKLRAKGGRSGPRRRVGKDGKSYPATKKPVAETADEPAVKVPKSGTEEIAPEQRKALRDAFGTFVRLAGKVPRWKQMLEPLTAVIAEVMAKEWASSHRKPSQHDEFSAMCAEAAAHCLRFIPDGNLEISLTAEAMERWGQTYREYRAIEESRG